MVKNPPANAGDMRYGLDPWVGKIPLEEGRATHSSFLPGKSHGQRSLVGYSPWSLKESDTTEVTACTDTLCGSTMYFTCTNSVNLDPKSSADVDRLAQIWGSCVLGGGCLLAGLWAVRAAFHGKTGGHLSPVLQ